MSQQKLKYDAIYKLLSRKVLNYLNARGIIYFKAKQIFPIFRNELPNKSIGDLNQILGILRKEGKIEKWNKHTWMVIKKTREEEIHRLGVYIPKSLWLKAKLKGINFSKLMRETLEKILQEGEENADK